MSEELLQQADAIVKSANKHTDYIDGCTPRLGWTKDTYGIDIIKEAATLIKALADAVRGEKLFPIINSDIKFIPWSVAQKVYHCGRWRCQTLERLAERGGFHEEELNSFYPAWRSECAELEILIAENQALADEVRGKECLASRIKFLINSHDEGNSSEKYILTAIMEEAKDALPQPPKGK